MALSPDSAPVLSTPDSHIFEQPVPVVSGSSHRRSDEAFHIAYEIQRTLAEIRRGRWRRIALQFPDEMLQDAPRVFELLHTGLKADHAARRTSSPGHQRPVQEVGSQVQDPRQDSTVDERLYILADTSYGSCCVDEIAAEHVDADVVVHYGRACLSPTARLPVIHVFTVQDLDIENVTGAFQTTYPDQASKIILLADVTYSSHLPSLYAMLQGKGYVNLFCTSIIHDPSSPMPNRTVPDECQNIAGKLKDWHVFHVSDPPQSLLLTLSSRVASIHLYPTSQTSKINPPESLSITTSLALRRRYALLTSLSTVSIFGILINTLSVKNYVHIVEHVKKQIALAGKKSYTFVVGKVNAAKVANFSEVGGWVVIGCWESSLIESQDFWKPLITPFELELALQSDSERVWTGDWMSDFQSILDQPIKHANGVNSHTSDEKETNNQSLIGSIEGDFDSEPESAPPEFDLRTGRYLSNTRPMQSPQSVPQQDLGVTEHSVSGAALVRRAKGDIATIGGKASPGAEFLQSRRTWKGLGSDMDISYDDAEIESRSTTIEEGRSGIARGYTHGDKGATR
ncbi:Diphthamide biosynthesis protein 2 [Bachmanniomyces sp. S44760]|nr:Diphthamide biosynthesis protein 2 [Bachmanniomyces sp. S44760]